MTREDYIFCLEADLHCLKALAWQLENGMHDFPDTKFGNLRKVFILRRWSVEILMIEAELEKLR